MAPNLIIRGYNFQKVDHSKLLNCTEMKTAMLTFNLTSVSFPFFFIVSLPFSMQLPERHNRGKEKFLKNLFVSNFYQKTNLKQIMAQNSSFCFVNFHVFFVCSFSTRKKDWNKFLAKLHVSLRTSDLSTETLCWKEREDCSRPLWMLFYFIALCWKTIKSPFHPNAKQ